MSRQFQLYVLPSDAQTLIEEFRNRFGVRILDPKSLTREPLELSSPILGYSTWFKKNKSSSIDCYLARAEARIDSIFFQNLREWTIRPTSEAIEFSGCDFDGETLSVGRLYYQTDVLIDGRIEKKRDEFLKWANDVFRAAKRALIRDVELDAYVGKDAAEFRRMGGKFATHFRAVGDPAWI